MKISFTLSQMKQFNSLTADERERFITTCETLSQMPDEAIDNYEPDSQSPAMVAEVHAGMKRRVAAARRRRSLREKQAPAAPHCEAPEPLDNTLTPAGEADVRVNVDESKAKAAAWVRTNYNRFVDRVVEVIGMLGNGDVAQALTQTWQTLTKAIYDSITPLIMVAESFMHKPRSARRVPRTYDISPELYAAMLGA